MFIAWGFNLTFICLPSGSFRAFLDFSCFSFCRGIFFCLTSSSLFCLTSSRLFVLDLSCLWADNLSVNSLCSIRNFILSRLTWDSLACTFSGHGCANLSDSSVLWVYNFCNNILLCRSSLGLFIYWLSQFWGNSLSFNGFLSSFDFKKVIITWLIGRNCLILTFSSFRSGYISDSSFLCNLCINEVILFFLNCSNWLIIIFSGLCSAILNYNWFFWLIGFDLILFDWFNRLCFFSNWCSFSRLHLIVDVFLRFNDFVLNGSLLFQFWRSISNVGYFVSVCAGFNWLNCWNCWLNICNNFDRWNNNWHLLFDIESL